MGKGDKKSKKGKRFLGSYGVTRKQKEEVVAIVPTEKKAKAPKPAKEAVEEKPKAAKKEAAEAKPKAAKKEPAEKKEAAPKSSAKKKESEE